MLMGLFFAAALAPLGILVLVIVSVVYALTGRSKKCSEKDPAAVPVRENVKPCEAKNPVKRTKTAVIKEVELRKTECIPMQSGDLTGFKLNAAFGFVDRLKGLKLSDADRSRLSVIEKNLRFASGAGAEKHLNRECGRLITILARYS